MVHDHCNKILVCTPSNKAVDEILKRVSEKGLFGTKAGEIVRIGSLEYKADESIKHLSLDQRVNQMLNSKHFEALEQSEILLEMISNHEGESLAEIVLEQCEKFIHPKSKRIKHSTES